MAVPRCQVEHRMALGQPLGQGLWIAIFLAVVVAKQQRQGHRRVTGLVVHGQGPRVPRFGP